MWLCDFEKNDEFWLFGLLCDFGNLSANSCNLDHLRIVNCDYVITGHYQRIGVIWTVWIIYVFVRKTMILYNFDRLCAIMWFYC